MKGRVIPPRSVAGAREPLRGRRRCARAGGIRVLWWSLQAFEKSQRFDRRGGILVVPAGRYGPIQDAARTRARIAKASFDRRRWRIREPMQSGTVFQTKCLRILNGWRSTMPYRGTLVTVEIIEDVKAGTLSGVLQPEPWHGQIGQGRREQSNRNARLAGPNAADLQAHLLIPGAY